ASFAAEPQGPRLLCVLEQAVAGPVDHHPRLNTTTAQEHLVQYTSVLDSTSGSSTGWPLGSLLPADTAPSLPCQDLTTADLWFAERTAEVEQAKALCQSCPIKRECLEGALARQEPWGVWGGE